MTQKQTQHLSEGLEYKDLVGMMKPTVHIDEFASKMGEDDDIIVASFYVRSRQAARDLENWFEKGYDWVLDAATSPGEIKPGRYLVYIEMRRRSSAGRNLATAIEDLSTLTEYTPGDWMLVHRKKQHPFSVDEFEKTVPLSPADYRELTEKSLNEMRTAAGLEPVQIHTRERDIQQLQAAAGI